MEPTHNSPSGTRTQPGTPSPAELIVHTGPHKGKRRPLHQPLTVIGRVAGCDLRLNVEGVGPLHCGLVNGANGLFLRNLESAGQTLVNGRPETHCPLNNGDILTVGPFQFLVRVAGPAPAQQLAAVQAKHGQEKDALRIQAAAVAAQQAALAEEEVKLQQRRANLEQQEEQLATHLEEKRRRLVEIRDQARTAHEAVKKERTAHDAKVKETRRELEAARRETVEGRKHLHDERERLSKLLQRLKRRFNRQLADERAALKRREEDVGRQKLRIDEEKERVQQDRDAVIQLRLRSNGEIELSRRQLQSDWEAFRQEQLHEEARLQHESAEMRRRSQTLSEREHVVTHGERELTEEKQHWHELRIGLERESEGLDNRIRNYRRKIAELEREVVVQQAQLVAARQAVAEAAPLQAEKAAAEAAALATVEGGKATPATADTPDLAATVDAVAAGPETAAPVVEPTKQPAMLLPPPVQAEMVVSADDATVQEHLLHLEKLSGELVDQRLHLVEQYQRLVEAQQHWQQQRDEAAADLEEAGKQLHARELEMQQREQALQSAEYRQQTLHRKAEDLRRHLEGWQSRMRSRETTWAGERDRVLADIQGKEQLAEQRLKAIGHLHERWLRRRRREVQWLQSERTAYAKLHHEYATLRQGLSRRSATLEREQRLLAERALALEQFQQECIGKADHPAGAARRLERLRSRWTALAARAQKAVDEQRQTLAKEAAELAEYHGRLTKQADKLTAQEDELARQLSAWEHARLAAQDDMNQLRADLQVSQAQRERFEQQVHDLRDEVERIARLLLDEPDPIILSASKAA